VGLFDTAVDDYDGSRPSYPEGIYDLLDQATGGLSGLLVADVGAGTGISTRQLAGRGADVIAVDVSEVMLARARARTPGLRAVRAAAESLPVATGGLGLACFAQSWHWVDQQRGAEEMSRVLGPGGVWAAWWNHPWADGEPWFDAYQELLEGACPGYSRDGRNVDWAAASVAEHAEFDSPRRDVVAWTRTVPIPVWLGELRSHSYAIALDEPARAVLVERAAALLEGAFPDGTVAVGFETRLWSARRAA
jgi:SAM-dependent methyltransferase